MSIVYEKIYDLKPFRVPHLFLLVGENPLPNYVVIKLLLEEDGHVYLVYTPQTSIVANNLIGALNLSSDRMTHIEVNEKQGTNIFSRVSQHTEGKQKIGLNYTGGTKTMAIHAYQAIQKHSPSAIFSYLDAATLSLIFDTPQYKSIYVGRAVTLSIKEILALHGYKLSKLPLQNPRVSNSLLQAIMRVNINKQAFKEWRNWLEEKNLDIPDLKKYPALQDVVDEFKKMGETSSQIAQAINPKWDNLTQCKKWLLGEWLEEYTIWSLQEAHKTTKDIFDDVGFDLMPRNSQGREFQFDVAFTRGYQLFTISCIATDKKEKAKEHLFEAYVRARQMGGEEARVGLVCLAPRDNAESNPSVLQREIEEAWFAKDKIRVFGTEHLPNLSEHLKDWIESQP